AGYWRFSLPPGSAPPVHTIPPDGVVSLCWLPHGQAVVVGPRVTALRVPVQPGAEYAGIRFLPGAAGPLLGIDVVSLRGAMIGIDPPGFAEVMRSQGLAGLDALLLRWTKSARWPGPDPVVAELTRRILATDGAATVAELVAGLGLSYRQILRRFYQAAGLTPKEFARLRRLRAACLSAVQRADPGWATVSAEAGYADQSHLSREFQDVYGWPPRLVHEYLRRIDHRLAAR
ncbi:MAG TPA: hypothetical protein DEH78_26065, partial [Solibacterales bacterium]|nr:hypothetical protein [Bryobacterales bacterium]